MSYNKIKQLAVFFLSIISLQAYGWGQTGHRTVGLIAQMHLTKKAKKQIARILEHESMAIASTWMDEIKSEGDTYRYASSWHYVSIPDGQTYETSEKNPKGDVIQAIETLVKELKAGNLSHEEEEKKLKFLIHLVGDIHQPLHVGKKTDRGGNDVKVTFFWEASNLHRVWDSGMIDKKKLSYTELAKDIDHVHKDDWHAWQKSSVRDWAKESYALRKAAYVLPEDKKISYKYMYKHYPTVKQQLVKAGIRLAGLLNDIYG